MQIQKKFQRTPEKIEFEIDYGHENRDSYKLIFDNEKVVANGKHEMDDSYMSYGYTHWISELPKNLVDKMLEEFDEIGLGVLEHKTKVKKTTKNRWGEYGMYDDEVEEYEYSVKVEIKKAEEKEELMIWFQEHMDIYF